MLEFGHKDKQNGKQAKVCHCGQILTLLEAKTLKNIHLGL
jgi:hypothetical protein